MADWPGSPDPGSPNDDSSKKRKSAAEKRKLHSEVEKHRRERIQQLISELVGLVPGAQEVSHNKADVLQRTTEFVRQIVKVNSELAAHNASLLEANSRLATQIGPDSGLHIPDHAASLPPAVFSSKPSELFNGHLEDLVIPDWQSVESGSFDSFSFSSASATQSDNSELSHESLPGSFARMTSMKDSSDADSAATTTIVLEDADNLAQAMKTASSKHLVNVVISGKAAVCICLSCRACLSHATQYAHSFIENRRRYEVAWKGRNAQPQLAVCPALLGEHQACGRVLQGKALSALGQRSHTAAAS
jgi:hypothetical protein